MRPEGLGKFKKCSRLVGSAIRDFSVCSIVPYLLRYCGACCICFFPGNCFSYTELCFLLWGDFLRVREPDSLRCATSSYATASTILRLDVRSRECFLRRGSCEGCEYVRTREQLLWSPARSFILRKRVPVSPSPCGGG
jgi:hypothetical protein